MAPKSRSFLQSAIQEAVAFKAAAESKADGARPEPAPAVPELEAPLLAAAIEEVLRYTPAQPAPAASPEAAPAEEVRREPRPRPSDEPIEASVDFRTAVSEVVADRAAAARQRMSEGSRRKKGLSWSSDIPVGELTGSYRQEAEAAARRLRLTLIGIVVAMVMLAVGMWLTMESPAPVLPDAAATTVVDDHEAAAAFPPKH